MTPRRTSLTGRLFQAITGVGAGAVEPGADLRSMLLAVGGPSRLTKDGERARTKSGIDLTRAAEQLGVSRRTVERWLKAEETGTGQRPSAAHAKTLATKARQAASTQRGRRDSLAHSGIRGDVAQGTTAVQLLGRQGIDSDYISRRHSAPRLEPHDALAMLDAWERGGEKGFRDWVDANWARVYIIDKWQVESIEDVRILRLNDKGEWMDIRHRSDPGAGR